MRVVAVVFGGPALEHEISVLSGRRVLEGLGETDDQPLPVLIERDGAWVVDGRRFPGAVEGVTELKSRGCDVAFLALHGPFGEDGTIQGFLETVGLPYTGSGVAGSALARDKIRAKRVLAAYGIDGAPDLTVPPATAEEVRKSLGFPVLVKNPVQGSTLGLEMAADLDAYAGAVERLGRSCPVLLVERREIGREFTASVLDDEEGRPQALPLIEIRVPTGFFDYDAKYRDGGAEEIVPAPLEEETARRIRECGLQAHTILGLRGMSRSDFILRPDGGLVFLETNSIPGLTQHSLLPKAAAEAGIGFPELLRRLVESALRT